MNDLYSLGLLRYTVQKRGKGMNHGNHGAVLTTGAKAFHVICPVCLCVPVPDI